MEHHFAVLLTKLLVLIRRDGYNSVQYCEQVVADYIQNEIPLETFLTDIQYMNDYQDFSLSNEYSQSEFSDFVNQLHKNGQRWVGSTHLL